jgi:hypothetical protein
MSIKNVGKLVLDFQAIIASATNDQLQILTSLREALDERIAEVEEDIVLNPELTRKEKSPPIDSLNKKAQ